MEWSREAEYKEEQERKAEEVALGRLVARCEQGTKVARGLARGGRRVMQRSSESDAAMASFREGLSEALHRRTGEADVT